MSSSSALIRKDCSADTALQIIDFLVRTEETRFDLFRRHMLATVSRASPLLLDLAIMEGIDICNAVSVISPPEDWPWRPLNDFAPALFRRSQQQKSWLVAKSRNDVARFRRTFAAPGVVIRDADHQRGRFAIRPCQGVLGFTAALGPCLLSAFGSTAMLKFPDPLPETLMSAMAGRTLGGIIDHPLFAGGDYTIRRVMSDHQDGLPVFTFRAALIDFSMPFADAPRA